MKEYTFYVVVNDNGKYTMYHTEYFDSKVWTEALELARFFNEYVTAEWRATKYGGKVKEVTVTVKD